VSIFYLHTFCRTPLWWSAKNGQEAVVKLLLETGKLNANLNDGSGRTPLWWAAKNGHEAVLKLFAEMGKAQRQVLQL
jgi:ankyrin repeat protein